MKNLTNYHSHCSYCDGHAPLEEFVKTAIDMGFTSYGVSSHAPLPFPTSWTLKREDVFAYLAEIKSLKAKYSELMELYAGMEIDYLDEESNPSISYFQELPLDYRIGSVHLLTSFSTGEVIDIDTSEENFKKYLSLYFNQNLKGMIYSYFYKLMRMVEAGGFDIVGHADKMSYNASCCKPELVETGWYNTLIQEYFALIKEKGMMVEINTKSFEKRGVFFPHIRYFPLLKKFGIPVLVNSDAHYPGKINLGRPQALNALKEAGIKEVMELHKGKWKAVGIGTFEKE